MKVFENQIYAVPKPTDIIVVRQADLADVQGIVDLVNEHARQGHLLPRSADNIRASIHTWVVAEVNGDIVGIGSLLEMSPVLAEVRSLAVLPAFRSYGIGAKIVQELIEQARRRGFPTVFALTRAVHFFQRIGFTITERERFPEKVWTDCAVCPLRHACDETAVVMDVAA